MTAVTLFLVIRMIDPVHLRQNIVLVPWWFYVVAISLTFFRTWMLSVRWRLLNSDLSGQISGWQYFRFSVIARLYDFIMPGALGGDIIKGGYVWHHVKEKKGENIISMLVDRLVGLVSMLSIGFIALLFARERLNIDMVSIVAVTAALVIVTFLLERKDFFLKEIKSIKRQGRIPAFIGKTADTLETSLNFYRKNRRRVFLAFCIALPVNIIPFLFYFLKVFLLQIDISLIHVVFVLAIASLISALPISLGGHGVRELSLVYLFGLFGVTTDQVITLVAVSYLQKIIFAATALLFLVDMEKIIRKFVKPISTS